VAGVIAGLLVGLVALAFLCSLADAGRHPPRYERLYDERLWKRVDAWVWGLTLAVLAGMLLGGASTDALGVVAVVGFVAGFICARFISATRLNRRMRDRFND
jgi:TRAP-type C4-dicarboxylate transport system permease large subunit